MRTLCLVVALGLGGPAVAQEPRALPDSAEIEELVVSGRRPENLRVEIERLEEAVYERFNALNSDDEFDIYCLKQPPTGSNIPLRTCAPNFVIRAESSSANKMVTDGRSGDGNNFSRAEQQALMQEKSVKLTEEIQRVAREDELLLRGLVRLDELKQLQSSERGRSER